MTTLHTTFTHFLMSEEGAVTVDMVPLMALAVSLCLAVMGAVSGGVENLSGEINTQLADQQIASAFEATEPATPDAGQRIIRISARVGPTR